MKALLTPFSGDLKLVFLAIFMAISTAASAGIEITNQTCICNDGALIELSTDPDPGYESAGPFTFEWRKEPAPGIISTEKDLTNITEPGVYTVTVTNAYGCSTQLSTNVMVCPYPTLSTSITNVTCYCPGAFGMIEMDITGGSSSDNYIIEWTGPNGFISSEPSPMVFEQGQYNVTVTDMASGCTSSESVTVPDCTFDISNFNVQVNDACEGPGTGSISIQIPAGEALAPYAFMLKKAPAANFPPVISNDGSFLAENLPAGEYCISIMSANNCSIQNVCGYFINEYEPPTVSFEVTPPSSSGSNDGNIDLTVEGGSPLFTYSWSNGATTEDNSNLFNGNYMVTVSYASSACQVDPISIVVRDCQSLLAMDVDAVVSAPSNLQMNNGAIDVTIPIVGYDLGFNWFSPIFPQFSASTEDIDGLIRGTYCLEIHLIDCASTVNPICWDVCDMRTRVVEEGSNCNVVRLLAEVSANHGTLSYKWSNGSTNYTIDANYGTKYCVTVTDTYSNGNSCESHVCTTPSFPALEAMANVTNSTFGNPNGSISIIVNGGFPTYNYTWSNGAPNSNTNPNLLSGFYHVTITDACNNELVLQNIEVQCEFGSSDVTADISPVYCESGVKGAIDITLSNNVNQPQFLWSNDAITEDIDQLVVGTYYLTITDESTGCFAAGLDFYVPDVGSSYYVKLSKDSGCPGGALNSLNAFTNGGMSPFSYAWEGFPQVTTATLSDVPNGWYYVTVTDGIGCSEEAGIFIEQIPPVISIDIQPIAPCSNELETATATATIANGTPPYVYQWFAISNSGTSMPIPGSNQPSLGGLYGGKYQISITDRENCGANAIFSIRSKKVSANIDTHHPCDGDDGYIHLTPKGGKAPYSFVWSDGETSQDRNNLAVGCYSVTISDVDGCEQAINDICLSKPLFDAKIASYDFPCKDSENGEIKLEAKDVTHPPLTVIWDDGSSGPMQLNSFGKYTYHKMGLGAGTHCATITDSQGCTKTLCKTLDEMPKVYVKNVQNPTYAGGADGYIELANLPPSLGVYSYTWSNGATSRDVFGIAQGSYSVTVSHRYNSQKTCTETLYFNLIDCDYDVDFVPVTIEVDEIVSLTGANSADGAISIKIVNGNGPFYYTWLGPEGLNTNSPRNKVYKTPNISGLEEGIYCVTVTDGCSVDNLCQIIDYCGDNTTVLDIQYPGVANCLLPGQTAKAYVYTDLGWGWVTNSNNLPNPGYDWNYPNGITSGPHKMAPAIPYQHKARFDLKYNDVYNHGGPFYTVEVTDAAGCTSDDSHEIVLGFEQPIGWTYRDFPSSSNTDVLAFWAFREFINNNPQYASLAINEPIKGCKTEISCNPWPPGSNYDGLLCNNEDDTYNYPKCDCPMGATINVRCKEFPDDDLFYSYNSQLVTSVEFYVSGCTYKRYCMYYEPTQQYHPFIFTETYEKAGCDTDDPPTPYYTEFEIEDLLGCSDFSVECVGNVVYQGEQALRLFAVYCNSNSEIIFYFYAPVSYNEGTDPLYHSDLFDFFPPSIVYAIDCGGDFLCTSGEIANSLGIVCGPSPNPLISGGGGTEINPAGLFSKNSGRVISNVDEFALHVFPNLVTNELNIEINSITTGVSVITVSNILGNTVWSNQYKVGVGMNKYTWTPSKDLPAGIYLLKAVDERGNSVVKNIVLSSAR